MGVLPSVAWWHGPEAPCNGVDYVCVVNLLVECNSFRRYQTDRITKTQRHTRISEKQPSNAVILLNILVTYFLYVASGWGVRLHRRCVRRTIGNVRCSWSFKERSSKVTDFPEFRDGGIASLGLCCCVGRELAAVQYHSFISRLLGSIWDNNVCAY